MIAVDLIRGDLVVRTGGRPAGDLLNSGGLTLALLVLLAAMLQRRRKIEPGMVAWMGAMLFAFPALRNVSPGIPPIVGTRSDDMAFFWAECPVALVLLVSVTTWLVRPQS